MSDLNSCIKCDKGGNLLVCSEYGCPIAVHAGCLGFPARFDDARGFYCPYCLYKQAVAESHKAREHALARKKALMFFMEGKVIGSEKHMGERKTCEDNGHNQSKTSFANFTSRANGRSKSNNNGIRDQPFQLEEDSEASAGSKGQDPSVKMHGEISKRTEEEKQVEEKECKTSAEEEQVQEKECKTSAEEEQVQEKECKTFAEEEQIQEEERETSAEEQIQEEERGTSAEEEQIQEEERETSVEEEKTQEEERGASVEEEKTQEEERRTSVEEEKTREEQCGTSVEEEKTQEEEHEISVEEEKIQEEECEMSSASTDQEPFLTVHARAKRGTKRSKPVDKDSDVDPVQSKLLKQHDKKKKTSPLTVTPTRRSFRKSSSAVGSGKLVNEKVGSPGTLRKPEESSAKLASNMFGSPKRKRLLWTEEEEDTLRAGVETCTKEGNINIPWRKILVLFRHKFDATRTPSDLKDKWRNMSGR